MGYRFQLDGSDCCAMCPTCLLLRSFSCCGCRKTQSITCERTTTVRWTIGRLQREHAALVPGRSALCGGANCHACSEFVLCSEHASDNRAGPFFKTAASLAGGLTAPQGIQTETSNLHVWMNFPHQTHWFHHWRSPGIPRTPLHDLPKPCPARSHPPTQYACINNRFFTDNLSSSSPSPLVPALCGREPHAPVLTPLSGKRGQYQKPACPSPCYKSGVQLLLSQHKRPGLGLLKADVWQTTPSISTPGGGRVKSMRGGCCEQRIARRCEGAAT